MHVPLAVASISSMERDARKSTMHQAARTND
jgi:hypothetical protein